MCLQTVHIIHKMKHKKNITLLETLGHETNNDRLAVFGTDISAPADIETDELFVFVLCRFCAGCEGLLSPEKLRERLEPACSLISLSIHVSDVGDASACECSSSFCSYGSSSIILDAADGTNKARNVHCISLGISYDVIKKLCSC